MEEPKNHKKTSQFPYPQPNSALRQNPTNRGKSLTHFLFKACFFAAIIVSVPLFPSQAPEFISQSPLTKFWELIHLLFIGIAVSYGLFCRRNVEPEIEFEIQAEMEPDSFQHGMSRMFHISSRSEEGYESLPGFDEKRMIQNPTGNNNNNSLLVENSTIQAWNSKYFHGNPMAVVAQPNCSFVGFPESGSEAFYKPLGLPVRSLRESSEFFSTKESGSGSFKSIESFGHLGHENSENEPVASPSPIPWRSRSARRENISHGSLPSHFRPLSADETQFESFQTMRTSSASSSQGDDSPANSVASVVMGSNIEDELQETSFLQGSYASSDSPSPPPKPRKRHIVRRSKSSRGSSSSSGSPMDGKASTGPMHSRGYSFGSVYENKVIVPKESLKESIEASNYKESHEKKPNLKKASARGKSVRTVRSYGLIREAENSGDFQGSQVDDQDVETVFWGNNGVDSLENGNSEQSSVPKPTTAEIRGFVENVSAKSERDYETEAEKFRKSMSMDTDSESVRGSRTPDSNEVDKKAGEFIAKFREQIRLQKVASMDRTRGLRFGLNSNIR